jgi:restriction endonuclease NaeI
MAACASLDSCAVADDPELRAVADALMSLDSDGKRIAKVLRRTYDMLLDGQHTGMIPPEAVGQIILGLWASDDQGKWSLGLVRADGHLLTSSRGNRDLKRRLTAAGKAAVTWLFLSRELPENALLRIPPADVERIFTCRASRSASGWREGCRAMTGCRSSQWTAKTGLSRSQTIR